jgi:hypothetical protein
MTIDSVYTAYTGGTKVDFFITHDNQAYCNKVIF